jgi:hypothetical protein
LSSQPTLANQANQLLEAVGWSFYAHMAWGAAYQLVSVLPPVAAARQIGHNFQVIGKAASLADRGEWDLAANALAELPQENAEAAARILTAPINAAMAIPGAIDTALNSTDPEKKGQAAVVAIQDIATVAMTVVAVGGAGKGKAGASAAEAADGAGKPRYVPTEPNGTPSPLPSGTFARFRKECLIY